MPELSALNFADKIYHVLSLIKFQKHRGHNLLEMLIATLIFTTAMIAFGAVYQYISIATAKARNTLMGQYLAKKTMEACVAARYTNVDNLASVPSGPASYAPIVMTFRRKGVAVTTNFYREVQVDPSFAKEADGSSDVFDSIAGKLVRVKVSWDAKNRDGVNTRPFVEYRTYISENS